MVKLRVENESSVVRTCLARRKKRAVRKRRNTAPYTCTHQPSSAKTYTSAILS
jgi:hypothetical protein